MKKFLGGILSVALVCGLVQAPVAAQDDNRKSVSVEFEDTKKLEWVKDSIGRMKSKGIFVGYEDGNFRPNQPVSRIQSIITAVRLLELEDEAKAMNPDEIELHFNDADKLPDSVKGYVAVALESGLFGTDENRVDPYKPASRLWISSVLVRALSLEEEALASMNDIPDFKDVNRIPAGSLGYVNVAVDYNIFTGTLSGNFQPEKNITRSQMAAVLDRTYGELLEENGSVTVDGEVESISFEGNEGTLTLTTAGGEELTFTISKDLLVQYKTRFMAADQIRTGDFIEVYVKEGAVQEASVYTELPDSEPAENGIQQLKVEAEADDHEFELKYQLKKGKESGKVEIETPENEEEFKGEEALSLISDYIAGWGLASDITEKELTEAITASLAFTPEELEVHVKFADGSRLKFELEDDEQDDEDEDDDDQEDDDQDDDNDNEDDDEE
ncbi:S-layer homology domain-containing protein [Jeotgalibacillus malaysiensis]|uniref:S-layer homology domain-containing protein n=1 Tax=Jeotgalibacillus malaysiensis TaxID=1508404 RepID=UPI00384D60E6